MVFTLKISQNGKVIKKAHTHKIRRFLKILRSIKWQDSTFSVYANMQEAKYLDKHGKYTMFYNDVESSNKEEFWQTINAFMAEYV